MRDFFSTENWYSNWIIAVCANFALRCLAEAKQKRKKEGQNRNWNWNCSGTKTFLSSAAKSNRNWNRWKIFWAIKNFRERKHSVEPHAVAILINIRCDFRANELRCGWRERKEDNIGQIIVFSDGWHRRSQICTSAQSVLFRRRVYDANCGSIYPHSSVFFLLCSALTSVLMPPMPGWARLCHTMPAENMYTAHTHRHRPPYLFCKKRIIIRKLNKMNKIT